METDNRDKRVEYVSPLITVEFITSIQMLSQSQQGSNENYDFNEFSW